MDHDQFVVQKNATNGKKTEPDITSLRKYVPVSFVNEDVIILVVIFDMGFIWAIYIRKTSKRIR